MSDVTGHRIIDQYRRRHIRDAVYSIMFHYSLCTFFLNTLKSFDTLVSDLFLHHFYTFSTPFQLFTLFKLYTLSTPNGFSIPLHLHFAAQQTLIVVSYFFTFCPSLMVIIFLTSSRQHGSWGF